MCKLLTFFQVIMKTINNNFSEKKLILRRNGCSGEGVAICTCYIGQCTFERSVLQSAKKIGNMVKT